MSDHPKQGWKSAGVDRLAKALRHQTSALRHGLQHDPAIRQVTLAVLALSLIALFLPVTRIERLLLILSVMLVAVLELLNSALEACVDRISLEPHPLSGRAKDYASAAVGGAALMAAICWLVIAGPAVWQLLTAQR